MSVPGRHASITYQPALDGVRALAVLAVLLFHAQVPGFSGGYLGVSVFFTLSGFLITSLLVAEHRATGTIASRAFYLRRIRRLLPASMLCIAAVLLIATVTDVFDRVTRLREQSLGALFQVANWVDLFSGGSYQELFAQQSGAVSPLEHYWSLAIEEQFYWIWPIAFIGLIAVAATRERRIVVLAVVTAVFAALAPLIAVVWGPDAAYWATPARAAEILIGALLALVIAGRTLPGRVALAAPLALVVLGVCVVTFPAVGGPAYHGALPLVAVVSAALLMGVQVDGPVRSALSIQPLIWLGGISYGVYLYHWPIYVILDQDRTGLDGAALVFVRIGVTLVIAQLSYTLVERPIRTGVWLAPRTAVGGAIGATAALAILAVALIPAASSTYWTTDDELAAAVSIAPPAGDTGSLIAPSTTAPGTTSESSPESSLPSAGESTTPTTVVPATTTTEPVDAELAAIEGTEPLAAIELARPIRVVVGGDSTAEAVGAGLIGWAGAHPGRAQVSVYSLAGCGFVRGGERLIGDPGSLSEQWQPVPAGCDEWATTRFAETVAPLAPDAVMLLTGTWDVLDRRWSPEERLAPTDPAYRRRIATDLRAVTDSLLGAGVGTVVWVLSPIPDIDWGASSGPQEDPERHAVLSAIMKEMSEDYGDSVAILDLPAWLATTDLETDRSARPDGVHWTPEIAQVIAEEYLAERLIRLAVRAQTGGS